MASGCRAKRVLVLWMVFVWLEQKCVNNLPSKHARHGIYEDATYFLSYGSPNEQRSENVIKCTMNRKLELPMYYNCTGHSIFGNMLQMEGKSCHPDCTTETYRESDSGFITNLSPNIQLISSIGRPLTMCYMFENWPSLTWPSWIYMCNPDQVFRFCVSQHTTYVKTCQTYGDFDPCTDMQTVKYTTTEGLSQLKSVKNELIGEADNFSLKEAEDSSHERISSLKQQGKPIDIEVFHVCVTRFDSYNPHVLRMEFSKFEDHFGYNFTNLNFGSVMVNEMDCNPECSEGYRLPLRSNNVYLPEYSITFRFEMQEEHIGFTIGNFTFRPHKCMWLYQCTNDLAETNDFNIQFSICHHSYEKGSCYADGFYNPCKYTKVPNPIPTAPPFATTVSITTQTTTTISTTTTITDIPVVPSNPALKNISEITPNLQNVGQILNSTLSITKSPFDINPADVALIAEILSNCSKVVNMTDTDNSLFMKNVDYVMDVDISVLRQAGVDAQDPLELILNSLPRLVTNAAQDVHYSGMNIGLSGRSVNCSTGNVGITDDGESFSDKYNTVRSETSIEIPADAVCGSQASHAMVTVFRKRQLFMESELMPIFNGAQSLPKLISNEESRKNDAAAHYNNSRDPCKIRHFLTKKSPVLSASLLHRTNETNVNRISRFSLEGGNVAMAKLRIDVSKMLHPLHGRYQVSWWDTARLQWADHDMCTTSFKHGFVHAECNHLTDFTLLIEGLAKYPPSCDRTLTDIGYVIYNTSMILLVFLIVVGSTAYMSNPRVWHLSYWIMTVGGPQRRNSIAIAYYSSLFLFYFFFTIFSEQRWSDRSCEAFGALTYYLLLSSIFLMLFQSFRISRIFISQSIAHNWLINKLLQVRVAIGISICIPGLLTTFLGIFTSFFKREDGFCWVRPDYVVNAVVIPLSIVILNSLICTTMIAIKLFFPVLVSKSSFTRSQLRQRIVTILLLQITLGTPWIMQYLSLFDPRVTACHYVFTIVNGGQGVMAFSLWAYRRYRQYKLSSSQNSMASKPLTGSSRTS